MRNLKNEKELDELIKKLRKNARGDYITQGVSFNKNNPEQMRLLKWALSESPSFSGHMKTLINEEMKRDEERKLLEQKVKMLESKILNEKDNFEISQMKQTKLEEKKDSFFVAIFNSMKEKE